MDSKLPSQPVDRGPPTLQFTPVNAVNAVKTARANSNTEWSDSGYSTTTVPGDSASHAPTLDAFAKQAAEALVELKDRVLAAEVVQEFELRAVVHEPGSYGARESLYPRPNETSPVTDTKSTEHSGHEEDQPMPGRKPNGQVHDIRSAPRETKTNNPRRAKKRATRLRAAKALVPYTKADPSLDQPEETVAETNANKLVQFAKENLMEDGDLLYTLGIRCENELNEVCNEVTKGKHGTESRGPMRKAVSDFFGRNQRCTRDIPLTFWIITCRKHYQRGTFRAAAEGNLVRFKLTKVFAEVKLVDELCQCKTAWTIDLKASAAGGADRESATSKLEPDAKKRHKEAMRELTTQLYSGGVCGKGKQTHQVIAVLDMIGEAFNAGLKDMPKIQFLPSGMPTGDAAPAKPTKAIRAYIREAEHHFNWLESPEDHQEGGEGIESGTATPSEADTEASTEEDFKDREETATPQVPLIVKPYI